MMRTMTVVRQYLATAFLVVTGLIAYGCGDSATVNPEATLANLTVTIGTDTATLDPVFNPATTSYTVKLSNIVRTVTVSAQPAVSGDNVTIDGQATTSRVIDLGPPAPAGSTTLVSITVSDPPNTPRTYTVLLRRDPLDGNNSLRSLTVSPGTLNPEFAAVTEDYTVDVANTVSSVTVTPALSDPSATMTVNGQATNSGQTRTVTLGPAGGTTDTNIVVTAQNRSQKTYTIRVSRGIATNNNLQGLTVSPGTLNPAFTAATTIYTVNVASSVASVTVTPRLQDPTTATMTMNGTPATSGQARAIPLNGAGSPTLINIAVTAQNGSQKAYTVNVARAALGGNNNLQSLTISPGTLVPAFTAATTNYTVDVASSVANMTVTPRVQDAAASMTVNGQAATSGQPRTITLNGAGSNTLINIVVTAPSGAQKTYTVNVNRAALGGNNNLQSLTISPGTLVPAFAAATTSYTVDVASSVTSVSVTPRVQDPAASMTVNGQPATSGQARTIPLNGAGSNTLITIVVTAPSGSQKLYTTTVERAALGGNNNLQSLTLSPGTLSPPFNASRIAYTVNVAGTVTSVTVTATLQDPAASMMINGQGTSSGQARSMSLGPPSSSTEIEILVTAPSGSQKTYLITVNRAALGSNNNLSGLTVSPGSLNPGFDADTTSYTVTVGSTITSVTVTATLQDTSASMTINGQGTSSGQARTITLGDVGSSTNIDILVTAPSGAPKTYSIVANRSAATEPPTPTVAPDLIREDDSCAPGIPDPAVCAPGTSKEDNVTNVARPRFRVPPPGSGETAKLYIRDISGSEFPSSFNPGDNTFRPNADLPDGSYDITYTLTNAGGESGESPAMDPQLRIDTTGP
jgi:hypothetical protein